MSSNRIFNVMSLLLVPALLHGAAATDEARGWSFSQRFQGSSNSAGFVLKNSSTVRYIFNDHVEA